jgi:hypothetical protein
MSFDGHKKVRNAKLLGITTTDSNVFQGDLIPELDGTYDIGENDTPKKWKEIHADDLIVSGGVCFGDPDFCTEFIEGIEDESRINFDAGDYLNYNRNTNTFEFKVSTNPNPDVTITNGVTRVSDKIEIADANTFINKITTGPSNGDVTFQWGVPATNETSCAFDSSLDTLTWTVEGVNRLRLADDGLIVDPTDGNQTPMNYYEETGLFAAIDYTDSGGVDNYQSGGGDVVGLVEFTRVGSIVTMFLGGVVGQFTLGSTIDAVAGALVTRFRPLVNQSYRITINDGSSIYTTGVIEIRTDGSFSIGRVNLNNFNTGVDVGFGAFTLVYSIRDFSP